MKFTWFVSVGIEIDLTSVLRSEKTWLLCGGSKITWL